MGHAFRRWMRLRVSNPCLRVGRDPSRPVRIYGFNMYYFLSIILSQGRNGYPQIPAYPQKASKVLFAPGKRTISCGV
jgi:hypothetical protein